MPWPKWITWVIIGLVVAWMLFFHLRGVWMGWRLRRQGSQATGTVTGSRRYKSNVTYQVQSRTAAGQPISGSSQGWRWNDPEYFDGDEVTVYYDESHPNHFMLEAELEPLHLYGRLVLVVGLVALVVWSVLHPASR